MYLTGDNLTGASRATAAPAMIERSVSRYGEHNGRFNLPALSASMGVAALMVAGLLTLGIAQTHKPAARPTLVQMVPLEEELPPPPPTPPPPPADTPPSEAASVPTPLTAPPPVVVIPTAPVQQVAPTPPVPPVEIAPPAPPAPVAAPPGPPAIENAGDLSTEMVSATPPRYPVESRRLREEGTVVLMVVLNIDGAVQNVSLQRSSGHDRLDRAALSAVRRWRWSPTRRNGAMVMVRGIVEIPFRLS